MNSTTAGDPVPATDSHRTVRRHRGIHQPRRRAGLRGRPGAADATTSPGLGAGPRRAAAWWRSSSATPSWRSSARSGRRPAPGRRRRAAAARPGRAAGAGGAAGASPGRPVPRSGPGSGWPPATRSSTSRRPATAGTAMISGSVVSTASRLQAYAPHDTVVVCAATRAVTDDADRLPGAAAGVGGRQAVPGGAVAGAAAAQVGRRLALRGRAIGRFCRVVSSVDFWPSAWSRPALGLGQKCRRRPVGSPRR